MLISHLGRLRDARAAAGWIATTASRACLDIVARPYRTVTMDPSLLTTPPARPDRFLGTQAELAEIDAAMQRDEHERAVREGLAELHRRELLRLLIVHCGCRTPKSASGSVRPSAVSGRPRRA